MEHLKIALIVIALTGCATTPAPLSSAKPDRVPLALIPAGYTQDDCHYDTPDKGDEGSGGGLSGASTNAVGQADTRGKSHIRPFHCKRDAVPHE